MITPRAPMTPAPPRAAPRVPRAAVAYGYEHGDHGNRFAYVLVDAGSRSTHGSGNTADWAEVAKLRRQLDRDFLWVRDGDRRYVVVDSDVLDRIREALEPQREVGERQSKIGEAQSRIGERQSEIGEQQARIGEQQAQIGEEQARIASRMAGRSMSRASAQEFERRVEELSDRMEELSRMQERLGARMEPLSRQQEELGAEMEGLSREMERASRIAQREMRAQIERAIRDGKARPVR